MGSEVQTGSGILHGIRNNGTPITMTGYASFTLEGGDITHNFELDAIKDENKADKTLIGTNPHKELVITWTPTGATRAAARNTVVFLNPLAKVTLANFDAALVNGDWVYVGEGKINLTQGPGKQSMKLRKYDDAAQNASLVQTVVG